MNDNKHVDWAGLKYYDTQIKKYVDEVVKQLSQETVSAEELADVVTRLNRIAALSTANKSKIDELFNNDAQISTDIKTLFEFDKVQGENIRELQTRIESLVTKTELESAKGDIKVLVSRLVELEKSLNTDHVTIENILVALESKVSKEYVDAAIANIPTVNLDSYATKEYVTEKINDAVLNGDVDLTNYYNKETIDAKEANLNTKIDNNSAKIDELIRFNINQNKVIDEVKYSLDKDYYTKVEVDAIIEEALSAFDTPEADLSDYYTKDEVDRLIPDDFATQSDIDVLDKAVADIQVSVEDLQDAIDSIKIPDVSNFATKEELSAVQQQSANNDVKILQIDEELVNITSQLEEIPTKYATKQELQDAINSIEHPTVDLEGYATEEWVNSQGFAKVTDLPDVSNLATKDELTTVVNNIEENYVQNTTLEETIQNISDTYVTNETLQSANYATEEYVQSQNFVTEQYINNNYTTTEQLEANYVTNNEVTELVTNEVNTIVNNQIEEKVTEVIEQKIDSGELDVKVESIKYDTWDEDSWD